MQQHKSTNKFSEKEVFTHDTEILTSNLEKMLPAAVSHKQDAEKPIKVK